MLDALGPAQIADVHQAINTVFDFDECSKVGKVAHAAFDSCAHRELVMQRFPGIGFQLLHAQRNAPFLGVDIQHHALNAVVHVDDLRRMLHALGPGHLAHVH